MFKPMDDKRGKGGGEKDNTVNEGEMQQLRDRV